MKHILFVLTFAALFCSFTSNSGSVHFNKVTPSDTVHVVGEHYGGGIIFYVSSVGKHGLIVASTEQRKNLPWANGKNKLTGTTEAEQKQNVSGMGNTISIVKLLSGDDPTGIFAAKFCVDYSVVAGV